MTLSGCLFFSFLAFGIFTGHRGGDALRLGGNGGPGIYCRIYDFSHQRSAWDQLQPQRYLFSSQK